jgi:orotate phosphoribosyltransferase-like protein
VTTKASFKQDDVRRAVAGLKAAGVPIARIVVSNEGFEIIVGEPETATKQRRNPLDRLHAA